ncbi:MAG TPA: GNAT family N-acetyltransferase [Gemmatimonadaceae bacterium]|nr:GNAT family N-acetyltransferase [Gemmatimonadaceae bacterium]
MTAIAHTRPAAGALAPTAVDIVPLAAVLAPDHMDDWERLRARVASGSPFTRWAWLEAWSASADAAEREAAVVVRALDGTGALAAALPLVTRGERFRRVPARALTWAFGDLGAPDHLDVLAADGAPMDAIVDAIERLEWDVLRLDGIADDATGAPRLLAALERRGYAASLRPQWVCPFTELPDSWDAYLRTRSTARRKAIVTRERVLARDATVALTMHDASSFAPGWSAFLRLHDTRWNGQGAFTERLDALHRRFAASRARDGALWLATLEVNGETAAAWYGFVEGDTLYFYQSGRADAWSKQSVGAVLHGKILRRAIEHGLRRIDFLRGEEAYKAQWSSGVRRTYQLVAFRRSARGRVLRLADRAARWREQRAAAPPSPPVPDAP